jgi:hypothetical protein
MNPTGTDPDWEWEEDLAEDIPPVQVVAPDLAVLAEADADELRRLLDDYVRRELGRVLRLDPESVVTSGRPLVTLGVGSIMGLELQRRMQAALLVEISLPRLLQAHSATDLVEYLAGQYSAAAA